ncbi:Hypothetical protein HDN1F_36320 [gamma proteobacterium HdN1]|nr:Hypothetical protein HDN1F_36320 [gamma proteobacterium HdN1]
MLSLDINPQLQAEFPAMKGAGYLPWERNECGQSVNALVEELISPTIADAIGTQLGIERLSQYPTYVSICQRLNKRHGTIHTDGKSKVATALLYLNDHWNTAGKGCLRFLRKIDDINATIIPEIPPIYGTLAAFKRTENSFHGHLPFEGERRVIQVAWLVSAEDKARKAQRGALSHHLKKLLGWVDRKIGQGRDDSASRKVK